MRLVAARVVASTMASRRGTAEADEQQPTGTRASVAACRREQQKHKRGRRKMRGRGGEGSRRMLGDEGLVAATTA
jgi:hypothetical protein